MHLYLNIKVCDFLNNRFVFIKSQISSLNFLLHEFIEEVHISVNGEGGPVSWGISCGVFLHEQRNSESSDNLMLSAVFTLLSCSQLQQQLHTWTMKHSQTGTCQQSFLDILLMKQEWVFTSLQKHNKTAKEKCKLEPRGAVSWSEPGRCKENT